MSCVREESKAFCRPLKFGVPSSFSTTISPSSQAERRPRPSIVFASACIFDVQSLPWRVNSVALPRWTRASRRYPSNFSS